MAKHVYLFREGNKKMRTLLGSKGANLAEMTKIGLPVPPGFIVTTEACHKYNSMNCKLSADLLSEIKANLQIIEKQTNKVFGDFENPLLLSVRSGSVFSMPGMMDTILNLGINSKTVKGLIKQTNNRWFALDCYRRFIQMFSNIVFNISKNDFENILENTKKQENVTYDQQLSEKALCKIIKIYKNHVFKCTGKHFPNDPIEQLKLAIEAVFDSWNNERAIIYRNLNKIDHNLGTAINIQTMVFGNMGNDSGTGVAFTRNPSNGQNTLYGEYLFNAQGEDVVAGIRTPKKINDLNIDMPQIYEELLEIAKKLEKYYKNVQDIEFTIEKGNLFLLQTRNGKMSAHATIKTAYDLQKEGIITKEEALLSIKPNQLDQLLHPQLDPSVKINPIAIGLPASPGSACGKVIFSADEAKIMAERDIKTIFVSKETNPDDIHGMHAAEGILTIHGGMTSHAAVVARGMGKPCVCGCESLSIDIEKKVLYIGNYIIKEGEMLTIDGTSGKVIMGNLPLIKSKFSPECLKILSWADSIRTLQIRANADTPEDALKAREFGAIGIGLTRTEHMFLGAERLPYIQEMILAENSTQRLQALAKLLSFQENDFYNILKIMDGYPVCIRLLDPPLHEFLPRYDDVIIEIALIRETSKNKEKLPILEKLWEKIQSIQENNPMLGHRGCRLGISWPEIYEMQVQAIFNATALLKKEGFYPYPEIEIPLTIDINEMIFFKEKINIIAKKIQEENSIKFTYKVGTMIELPRAALLADELAEVSDFFSFGTNDLTQTTLGFSRDDAEGKFMNDYINKKIFKENPFITLDRKGVGQLMKIATEKGKKTRPNLQIGICGEHGGDPNSIQFCHDIGLDSISCSPFRIPIAKLAAAQAVLSKEKSL